MLDRRQDLNMERS